MRLLSYTKNENKKHTENRKNCQRMSEISEKIPIPNNRNMFRILVIQYFKKPMKLWKNSPYYRKKIIKNQLNRDFWYALFKKFIW